MELNRRSFFSKGLMALCVLPVVIKATMASNSTSKAIEELNRQGLSTEEFGKRLKASLILARLAEIDSERAAISFRDLNEAVERCNVSTKKANITLQSLFQQVNLSS
jgi:hypothetical protein